MGATPTTLQGRRGCNSGVVMGFVAGVMATLVFNNGTAVFKMSPTTTNTPGTPVSSYTDDGNGGKNAKGYTDDGPEDGVEGNSSFGGDCACATVGQLLLSSKTTTVMTALEGLPISGSSDDRVDAAFDKVGADRWSGMVVGVLPTSGGVAVVAPAKLVEPSQVDSRTPNAVSEYAPHRTQVLNESGVIKDLKPYLYTNVNHGARAAMEKLRDDFETANTPEEYEKRLPPKDFKLDLIMPLRNHDVTILDEVGPVLG